jgi:hypothetical protein
MISVESALWPVWISCRNGLPVAVEDQVTPGNEELQLVHQAKTECEKDQGRYKNSIGNHRCQLLKA